MPKFEFKLDQTSFISSIFPMIALVLGFVAPFQSKIKGCTFFHWVLDRWSTSSLGGLVAMPSLIKSPEVSLFFSSYSSRLILIPTLICIYSNYPTALSNRPCPRCPIQPRSTSPSLNAPTRPTQRKVEPSTNPGKPPSSV